MKLILDNVIFSLQKMGGISVYWYELLKRLSKDKDIDCMICQFNDVDQHIMVKEISQLQLLTSIESKWPVSLLRYLPFKLKTQNNVLFHSSYYRISKKAKNIITIYDFTYEFYRKGIANWLHTIQKKYAINNAKGIICISESTKKDLYSLYPNIKTPVKVIYIGKSDAFQVLSDNYQYSQHTEKFQHTKFILFVGARAGYKNFASLVEGLLPFEKINLVIVGSKLSVSELEFLEKNLLGRYFFMGFVDEMQLNELYNLAYCFIYPSLYEGFGIPVCEAMAAGCPVIAINTSSIPEVAGDAALLCGSLTNNVLLKYFSILDEPLKRGKLIAKGIEQATLFSWDRCYKQTIEFYKEIDVL